MMLGRRLAFGMILLAKAIALAESFEQRIEAEVARLVARHGAGKDHELKQRLMDMAKRDQAVRTPEYRSGEVSEVLVRNQQQVDHQLTSELKEIVARKGWPTISLVGLEASESAAVVLIHSKDHVFQRDMIPQLDRLARNREILPWNVAMLTDKILISEGKPQRFGTQWQWAKGVWKMMPVQDKADLDNRREAYLLVPITEYKKIISQMYDPR